MDILLLAPTFLIAIVCLKSRNAFFNLVLLFHHGFGYLEFLVFSSLHINKCFIWIILIYHQRNTCSPAGGMYVSISHCLRMECEAKWALGRITTNKASGGDGISVELFQILRDDAVKVLHSICQQIEDSAVAIGLEKVSFHSNPKERQCQRMLILPHNYTHLTS